MFRFTAIAATDQKKPGIGSLLPKKSKHKTADIKGHVFSECGGARARSSIMRFLEGSREMTCSINERLREIKSYYGKD